MYTLNKIDSVDEATLLAVYSANTSVIKAEVDMASLTELDTDEKQFASIKEVFVNESGYAEPFTVEIQNGAGDVQGYLGGFNNGDSVTTALNISGIELNILAEELHALLISEGVSKWQVLVNPADELAEDADASFGHPELFTKVDEQVFNGRDHLRFYNYTLTF